VKTAKKSMVFRAHSSFSKATEAKEETFPFFSAIPQIANFKV